MGTQYSVDNGNGFQVNGQTNIDILYSTWLFYYILDMFHVVISVIKPQNSTNLGIVSDYIRVILIEINP